MKLYLARVLPLAIALLIPSAALAAEHGAKPAKTHAVKHTAKTGKKASKPKAPKAVKAPKASKKAPKAMKKAAK